jgi:peptidyl-prolyl cis-trans isomerase C
MKMFIKCVILSAILAAGCSQKQAAVVNGVIIFESDVLESVEYVNPETVKKLGEENIKKNILDGLIERQLIACKASDEKYGDDEKIQKKWLPYKKNLSIKYFLNNYMPEEHPVSGKVLKDEYNKKKEFFKKDGQVHARHILIRTGSGKRSDKEAESKITVISKELKPDGSNFAELAKKYSECPSAKDGGDLNYFSRGQMVKPFEDAAFTLKKGEVTAKPVKTSFGYHLIFAEDVKEATYLALKEVKKQLIPGIYIADITKEYGVTVSEDITKTKDNLGEIKKLNYKFSRNAFRNELEANVGKEESARVMKDAEIWPKAVKEFLLVKAFEDKIKAVGMEKAEKYVRYITKAYNEFISGNYLENTVFNKLDVKESEVLQVYYNNFSRDMFAQQYGKQFLTDASFRSKIEKEEIFPNLRRRMIDQKKSFTYSSLIEELKKKYSVDLKIKYKTIKQKEA